MTRLTFEELASRAESLFKNQALILKFSMDSLNTDAATPEKKEVQETPKKNPGEYMEGGVLFQDVKPLFSEEQSDTKKPEAPPHVEIETVYVCNECGKVIDCQNRYHCTECSDYDICLVENS